MERPGLIGIGFGWGQWVHADPWCKDNGHMSHEQHGGFQVLFHDNG